MKVTKDFISPLNPEVKYFDLLNSINANLVDDVRMLHINSGHLEVKNRTYVWIRHDVDHDLKKAVSMARAEAEYGFYSTYFFLHTAPYWDTDELKWCSRDIRKMGHGIGLHHDTDTKPEPRSVFDEAMINLESISDGLVFFASAHGNIKNLGLWNQVPIRYDVKEAYFIRRDAYLSDSGHKWNGWIGKDIPLFEFGDNAMGAMDTVNKFNAMQEGVMQLLVHPCWWEVE